MAKEVFKIEWDGLDEFIEQLQKISDQTDNIILEEYSKFGLLAEEGAKALVHHDEGTLEDSINFDQAVKNGDEIIVRGGTNVEYALRRHEEPGIGEGTANKPSWRGYAPGQKYLENAVRAIEEDYDTMNIRILERILSDKL